VRWHFLKDALLITALGLFLVAIIQQISIITTNNKYERAQSAPTTNWQSRQLKNNANNTMIGAVDDVPTATRINMGPNPGSLNLDPISGSLTWVDVPAAPLVDDIFDPQPSSLPRLLVVVHSAATRDATMRQRQRKVCKSLYDRRPNVDMVFAVGVPLTKAQSVSSHAQGLKATEDEQRWSAQLMSESLKHGDLLVVPSRDLYVDLTLKTISWLEWGVNQARYDYIVKTDDEYCLNTTELDRLVDGHRGHELYFGVYEHSGTEYSSMRGADGSVAPFMSGAVYGLSIGLAASIIRDDRIHTMSYLLYGTSSDDANMGKWVDYATKRRELVVDHVVEPKLLCYEAHRAS